MFTDIVDVCHMKTTYFLYKSANTHIKKVIQNIMIRSFYNVKVRQRDTALALQPPRVTFAVSAFETSLSTFLANANLLMPQ